MNVWITAVLLYLLAVSVPVFGIEEVPIPTPVDGETWEFVASTKNAPHSSSDVLSGNYRITYQGGSLNVIQIIDGVEYQASPRVARHLNRLIAFGQDERTYLKFPLLIGKKWGPIEFSSQSPGASARATLSYSINYEVAAEEKIDTSIGKLPVLRLEGKGEVSSPARTFKTAWFYFYSPACRCIAKYFYDAVVGEKNSAKIEIEIAKHSVPGKELVKAR